MGTFQLDVPVLQAAAVPISQGCTAVAQALAQALRVDKATLPSLISFQVAQSKIATSQSTLLAGQLTSPLPVPSAQSEIWNVSTVELVSVIVTVVIFQLLELVILAIQFQVAPVAHCGMVKSNTAALLVQVLVTVALVQGFPVVVFPTVIVAAAQSSQSVQAIHCGILKSNTAFVDVQLFTTVAELQAAQVDTVPIVIVAAAQSCQSCQGFPCSHFRFLY